MKIFSYSTLETTLNKSTRSLDIKFLDQKEHGTLESLFELDSILNWAQARVEINAITIHTEQENFDLNFNEAQLKNFKTEYVEKLLNKIQVLSFKMMELPQSVIFDLGANPHSLTFQLSLGADYRMVKENESLKLSPLYLGLSPIPGVMSLSKELFGYALTKNIFLNNQCSSSTLAAQDVLTCYNEQSQSYFLEQILQAINSQAPIARVQTKSALSKMIKNQLTDNMAIETSTAKANHLVEDWKNLEEGFTPAQHMGYILKHLEKSIKAASSQEKTI